MSKRIPSPDSNSSLIGIYDDALTVKECESLMSKFEESEQIWDKHWVDIPQSGKNVWRFHRRT